MDRTQRLDKVSTSKTSLDMKKPRTRFMFEYDGPHRFNTISIMATSEEEAQERAEELKPNTNIRRLRNNSRV